MNDGIVRVKSAYSFEETIERLKKDVAAKDIRFFSEIDQSKLAADAGIKLNPSTLLVFGNPPLGTQFMTANPNAGLDWPVRLLVIQDSAGAVWTIYTDFTWIAARHGIANRTEQFKMASMVIASIIERKGLNAVVQVALALSRPGQFSTPVPNSASYRD